jgi:anti-sigma factor RsiW
MAPRLTPEDHADLVAYLDGELPPEATRNLEARLNTEPGLRSEAESLKRTWEMLDYLPRPEPAANFAEKTLSKIGPLGKERKSPPPLPARRPVWFWPAVAAGWAAAFLVVLGMSYGVWNRVLPREPSESDLVRDLRLIENKQAYDNIEDLDFLKHLDHPDLFGEDTSS